MTNLCPEGVKGIKFIRKNPGFILHLMTSRARTGSIEFAKLSEQKVKIGMLKKIDQWMPQLPVLAVWLWTVISHSQGETASDWHSFFQIAARLLLEFSPLLLAQWLMQSAYFHQRFLTQWMCWIGGMLLLPSLLMALSTIGLLPELLMRKYWLLASGASLLYWLHQLYQDKSWLEQRGNWLKKIWSLDNAMLLILGIWVLFVSTLLGSYQDPLNHQPIPMEFNFARIARYPLEFLSYLLQFILIASMIFGYYWVNRYILIRKVLAHYGPLHFVLAGLSLCMLSYPILATIVLQLPLNQVKITLLPSENHNPFDLYNLGLAIWIVALSTPLILAFERQQQEKSLVQIKHQQLQTELRLLQQQINPHFLFNTLNNLYALCLQQSPNAPKLVVQLANLLRYVVTQGQRERVSLQEELSYIQDYLALQQLRVSNKTTLTFQSPKYIDPTLSLPPLLLIMLIENAYKHGVESSNDHSSVEINIQLKDTQLHFICRNSLPSTSPESAKQKMPTQIGLTNLRRRLQLHFGDHFVLRSQGIGQHWHAELELKLS